MTDAATLLHRPGTLSRVLAAIALASVVAALPLAADEAGAQGTPAPTAERREALQDDLDVATADELRLAGELAAATAERDRLAMLLVDVERRSLEAVAASRAAAEALGRATAELSAAQARLRTTERDLADGIAELRDQAVDSFIVGGHDEPLGVFMGAEDIREMGAAATYRAVVLEEQDRIVELVEDLKVRRVRQTAAAAAAKRAAGDAATEAVAREQVVEAERSELQVLQASNEAAVATHAALLAEVQVRKAGYEAELAALVQISDSLAAALAARQLGQVANPALRGFFVLPVPTARMSSSFGPRVHPIFGTARLHAGIDLAAPTGTPIGAAGFGTVVTSGVLGGYGNAIVIDHGNGLSTLYGHLSVLHAQVGDVVEPNQTIGLVGSTGNSTGPHLHLEVRVFGTPVDPINYL